MFNTVALCAPAGGGDVDGADQDDSDHGFEGPQGKLLGARQKISRGVVDQDVERAVFPNGLDQCFDGLGIADVAGMRMNGSAQFLGRGCENFFSPPADVDGCSQFEEAASHAFAEPGAAAGDENALVAKQILLEHEDCLSDEVESAIVRHEGNTGRRSFASDAKARLTERGLPAPVTNKEGCGKSRFSGVRSLKRHRGMAAYGSAAIAFSGMSTGRRRDEIRSRRTEIGGECWSGRRSV